MRRIQRLSIVTIVSLLPALAWSAPPGDGPPEDNTFQSQGTGTRTQQQGPDSQTQTNPTAPPAPPPGGWGPPPTIQVNPQIQVQVNPRVDVEAKPQADADAKADAKADAQANPKADAKADIDTEIHSDSDIDSASEGSGTPQPTPPPQKVVRIIHKPVPPAPPPRIDRPAKRRAGLMVAGLFVFGGTYIGTAVNGAYLYEHCDRARDEAACRQMSTKMLIPVAGPFMAMQDSDLRSNQVKLGFLGGAQAAGAAMTLVGMVQHIRDGRKPGNRFVDADGVRIGKQTRVAPLAGGTGGGLRLNVRF